MACTRVSAVGRRESPCADCHPWDSFVNTFDAIFLPKVKKRCVEAGQSMDDVVRARLIIAVVILLFVSVITFVFNSTGHTLTSWLLRLFVFAGYIAIGVAVRLCSSPKWPSIAVSILLIVNSWVLLPWGSGAITLCTGTTQLIPIMLALMGGMKLGILGAIHALVYSIVVLNLDTRNLFDFPAKIPYDTLKSYMATRAIYLIILATILAALYNAMHNARLNQLHKMNVDLARAVREAQEAADLKTTFIATMSHEIRTPLNGIIGMAQVLSHSKLDANQRSELAMLQTCSESLLNIVNDILDLAKITANKVVLERAPLRVQEVVDKALNMVSIRAHDNRVQICHDMVGIEGAPEYIGDATRISQVVLNILTNAVKFTQARGEVAIKVTAALETGKLAKQMTRSHAASSETSSTEPPPVFHRVTFEISDTGIGIPSDKLDTIFEPFIQTDASTTRQHGGTGLGLTISRSLVRLMGGDIEVRSVVGSGSTFTFDMVLQVSPSTPPAIAALNFPAKEALNQHVLLLDDCHSHAHIMQTQLQRMGCTTAHVVDGKGASDALQKKKDFDWVLVNLQTYNPTRDADKMAFVLRVHDELDDVEKKRKRKMATRLRVLLIRNPWERSGAVDNAMRDMRHTKDVMWVTKPIMYDKFFGILSGQYTPEPPSLAPPVPTEATLSPVPSPIVPAAAAAALTVPPGHGFDFEVAREHGTRELANASSESSFSDDEDSSFEQQGIAGPSNSRSTDALLRARVAPNGYSLPSSVSRTGVSLNGHGNGTNGTRPPPSMSDIRLDRPVVSSDPLPAKATIKAAAALLSDTPVSSPGSVRSETPKDITAAVAAASVAVGGGSSATGTAPLGASPRSGERQPVRCLLVEDNKTNQQVVLRLLKVLGHTCDIANNGLEAVERVQNKISAPVSEMYNVILMDLHMPVMGGNEAAEKIKEILIAGHRQPVFTVAVSADALQTTKDNCLTNGVFDEFLPKPFLLPKLKAVLEQATQPLPDKPLLIMEGQGSPVPPAAVLLRD